MLVIFVGPKIFHIFFSFKHFFRLFSSLSKCKIHTILLDISTLYVTDFLISLDSNCERNNFKVIYFQSELSLLLLSNFYFFIIIIIPRYYKLSVFFNSNWSTFINMHFGRSYLPIIICFVFSSLIGSSTCLLNKWFNLVRNPSIGTTSPENVIKLIVKSCNYSFLSFYIRILYYLFQHKI